MAKRPSTQGPNQGRLGATDTTPPEARFERMLRDNTRRAHQERPPSTNIPVGSIPSSVIIESNG